MQFFSTRDRSRIVTSSEAIAQGLSDEGGLFVPESFPQVDVKAICEMDYPAMAAAIIKEYLTDYSADFLKEATAKTYGAALLLLLHAPVQPVHLPQHPLGLLNEMPPLLRGDHAGG